MSFPFAVPNLRASGQNYLSGGRKPPEFRSSQGAYAPRSGFCPLALSLALLGSLLLTAAAGAAEQPGATLRLANEDFLSGTLQASSDPAVIRWRSPYFATVFEFPAAAVDAVHYAVSGPQPKPWGGYCFELVNDDVLYGNLLALSDEFAEVECARIGRVHLRREQIGRLYRWKGADSIYLGPNGLNGWKDASPTPHWRDEGGQLVADQPGAVLLGTLGIPEQSAIEVQLSWRHKPDFVLALGVNDREASVPDAFRLEVWDQDLVALGESTRDADLASVQQLGDGEGMARIQMYLDQKQRRLIVLSRSGKPLAALHVLSKKKPLVLPGVRLVNKKGDVRLEQLRITRWNGVAPHAVQDDRARLHRTDGSIVYGRVVAFDPTAKTFTLRDANTDTVVPEEAMADLFLAPQPVARDAAKPGGLVSTPMQRVVYRDGTRLSGRVTRIEDAYVALTCPGVKEPLRLPLAGLRSLVRRERSGVPGQVSVSGPSGRLEMNGVRLKGKLLPGTAQPSASCMVWHPDLSRNASALLPGVAGRIVFREPAPPAPTPNRPQSQQPGIAGAISRLFQNRAAPPAPAGRRALHLRSGDTIPCEVVGIDDKGVTFKTPLSNATFVPHAKVKSVDLIPTRDLPQLDQTKRDRLLMLPRLHRDSPPTHLVCSKNGDVLRGRIETLDANRLQMEVRLETKSIPRDRLAQIIWLHADELAASQATPSAGDFSHLMRVQTLTADGNRLTFVAEKTDPQAIAGTSDVLGACRVQLANIDQLLLGGSIEQSAAALPFHVWKLHPAPEPKFVLAEAKGAAQERAAGTESPLVGQAAFPFKLDLLEGGTFDLAQHKGQVVVLDFWATWCGPCLQAMPTTDAVVREFADRKVKLVAVNLEERPDQVKATLARHKLKVTVALDTDGAISQRYLVTAIPQTVVINRDGKIARLFVGDGQRTADALRKALQELCPPDAPSPDKTR
jgi:thiol-disulfide isomerase/thioredoxin